LLPSLMIHDQEVILMGHRAKVLRNLVSQGTKLLKELRKLNLYLSDSCDLLTKDRLEKESSLIVKAKRLLSQRSFDMSYLTKIDLKLFSKGDKERILEILNLEKAKIKNYLQLHANKRWNI
jgi:hypothetical protein